MKRIGTCDSERREAIRLLAGIPLLGGAVAAACSSKGERKVVELPGQGPAAAPAPGAGPVATAAAPAPGGVPWAGKFSTYDLADRLGFASLRREGLWIDFGTTDSFKYTLGSWKSGWGRNVERGEVRHANAVTTTSRVFFPWESSEDLLVRMRVKRVGAEYASPYLNDKSTTRVDLPSGDWAVVSWRIGADKVKAGENHLMFRWSATQDLGG